MESIWGSHESESKLINNISILYWLTNLLRAFILPVFFSFDDDEIDRLFT